MNTKAIFQGSYIVSFLYVTKLHRVTKIQILFDSTKFPLIIIIVIALFYVS